MIRLYRRKEATELETEGWFDSARGRRTVRDRSHWKTGTGGYVDCLHIFICSLSVGLYEDHEFEKEDLVQKILEHYSGVTEEKAAQDVEKFLKTLADNNILDDGMIRGRVLVRIPEGFRGKEPT